MSQANILLWVPAKPLTPEQKADAARLKLVFQQWQDAEREAGRAGSQDEATEFLKFGQSALSQYLNAKIPLNARALMKFCALLRVTPGSISPSIVEEERRRAEAFSLMSDDNVVVLVDLVKDDPGLKKTALQKRRAPHRKGDKKNA